jgi:drug/metabolite transporter (DMT)-like permease
MAMDERKRQEFNGVALTLLATLLFGSSYVVVKLGVSEIDPLLFSTIVFAIGAVLILCYTLIRGTFKLEIFRHWEAWAAPLVTFALVCMQYVGLSYTTASTGALIIGANVLLVAPMAAIIFHERLGRLRILGLLVGVLGLFVLTTKLDIGGLSADTWLGDMLLVGTSACIALTFILSRFALRHMGFDQWTLCIHLLTPLLLFGAWMVIGSRPSSVACDVLPLILYVGILCTALPTMLWMRALDWISVVTSSTITLSESTFAVILSVVFLSEKIDVFVIVGAALVFSAIYMVVKGEVDIKSAS